jgi:hypothetical protein
MDFIERPIGISPDGGAGTTELLYGDSVAIHTWLQQIDALGRS